MTSEAVLGAKLPWNARSIPVFLRADVATTCDWLAREQVRIVWFCLGSILIGAGCYGAAIGFWRDTLQALYTGIKLPLVILLTTLGTASLTECSPRCWDSTCPFASPSCWF